MTYEYVAPERRLPPSAYTKDQLHELLVDDMLRHHATDLTWLTGACIVMGKGTSKGAEQAFKDVLADHEARAGHPLVPLL